MITFTAIQSLIILKYPLTQGTQTWGPQFHTHTQRPIEKLKKKKKVAFSSLFLCIARFLKPTGVLRLINSVNERESSVAAILPNLVFKILLDSSFNIKQLNKNNTVLLNLMLSLKPQFLSYH
ncbi:hypothetical protein ACOSP7_012012 [Xanthoceras sorbifolium]